MSEIKLNIRTFKIDTLKENAKKVQEEAGEAFAEYVILQERPDRSTTRLADEIADVIQASCNLAARYGIDLQAAMERCEQRNRERGRYPMEEEKHVESCGDCGGHDCDCGGSCGDVPAGTGDLRQKSPEEMSASELIEALYLANGYRGNGDGYCEDGSCTKTLGVDWCGIYHTCRICRKHLLDLLKAAHEREAEAFVELIKDGRDEYMRLRTENGIMLDELLRRQDKMDKLNQQVSDLTHERDGLRRRLAELDSAGITSLHRLLRETIGDAKCITDTARIYVEKARERRKPDSERKAVIKRLRELEFANPESSHTTLADIGFAILGKHAVPWHMPQCEELRDKLIELLSDGAQDA